MNRKKFLACLVGLPFFGALSGARSRTTEVDLGRLRKAADDVRDRINAQHISNEQIEVEWSVWCDGKEVWTGKGSIDADPIASHYIDEYDLAEITAAREEATKIGYHLLPETST